MKFVFYLFTFFIFSILCSCTNNRIEVNPLLNTPQDSSKVVNSCDTTKISYINDISPIMQKFCVNCHGRYSNYVFVQSSALDGFLYGTMAHSSGFDPMPRNNTAVDTCSLKKVLAWVNRGAPNN